MRVTGTKDMAGLRVAAIAETNAACGQVRARYITIAPGQELIYAEKEKEALRYLAGWPDPASPAPTLGDFPFIAAELGITAADPWTLAMIWVEGAAQFRVIGAGIETYRLSTIAGIEAAASPAALDALLAVLRADLAAYLAPS